MKDDQEAKRMARLLGGEVGYERTREQENVRKAPSHRVRHETVEMVVGNRGSSSKSPSKRRVETFDGQREVSAAAETAAPKKARRKGGPADDPSVPLVTSYFERVKMDRFAAQSEFDIKSSSQVLFSVLSIFSDPPDYVNPFLVNKRFNEYYRRLELLVTSTRTLLPRNNARRSERLKKVSPFSFLVLDTIRYWNIERIASDLAKIQSHPRTVRVVEFADILRAIYKPLFVMEHLDTDIHIKGAYRVLYKILYLEDSVESREKYQRLIRNALSSFVSIRRDLRYLLYPLLMKLISDRWLPYDRFFIERRRRFMAFINTTEADRIVPGETGNRLADDGKDAAEVQNDGGEQSAEDRPEEDPDDPEVIERKARQSAIEAEKKALDKGLVALETLFPKAGWDRLSMYPDLYPYFTDMFGLKKGYELIAPTDPLQQVAIFMHILEEFFFGIRYITFGVVPDADGDPVRVEDYLGGIINNWQRYIDVSFEKDYLPRLVEYCQILENTADSRTSPYARRILNELHWAKRLYFLPHYKYESIGPPPFRKGDITPIYTGIRLLRKYLTAVAAGIEQGRHQGGAEKMAPCDGIDNPWEVYNFEVPNPVSVRLDALLAPAQRNNASLVFFTLAVVTVLDHLVNNESSWAYETRSGTLFRSVNGEGIMPLFGVETKIDAEVIFKQMIRQRDKQA
ncbi:MAG: hypothetical protein LBS06_07820 [Treponema sp.]|nr:hypothetical protein [Treponema sp.]